MSEVIRFIPKAERERARLIREARAIYDSIFPPVPDRAPRDNALARYAISSNPSRSDGALS